MSLPKRGKKRKKIEDHEPRTPPRYPARNRGVDTIKRISKRGRYKDNANNKTPISKRFTSVTHCENCHIGLLSPKKKHCRRDAYDHCHSLENTGIPSFRGRLCMSCNTKEGIALKRTKTFQKHIEKWCALVYGEYTRKEFNRSRNYLARTEPIYMNAIYSGG